jgi:hypothetical protein
MYMLTKRTNILFDEDLWFKLLTLSEMKKSSIGKLVRSAVVKAYFADDAQKRIVQAVDLTLKSRKVYKGKIDYKKLIERGRKV